jgi:hypothetical protein
VNNHTSLALVAHPPTQPPNRQQQHISFFDIHTTSLINIKVVVVVMKEGLSRE